MVLVATWQAPQRTPSREENARDDFSSPRPTSEREMRGAANLLLAPYKGMRLHRMPVFFKKTRWSILKAMLREQGGKSILETIIENPPAIVKLVQAIADQVEKEIAEERSSEFSSAHKTTDMSDEDLFVKVVLSVVAKNNDPRLKTIAPQALVQAIRDVLDRKRGAKPWQNKP